MFLVIPGVSKRRPLARTSLSHKLFLSPLPSPFPVTKKTLPYWSGNDRVKISILEVTPMLRKPVLVVLGLLLAAGLVAAQDKAKKDDKDTSKIISGKVTKVDATKMTVSVTTDDGKKMDLTVTDDTKIVGPRGGVSKDRLKDDRLHVGAEIKIMMDGKKVTQIQLPMRKPGEKK
jgi:hypothetical protein